MHLPTQSFFYVLVRSRSLVDSGFQVVDPGKASPPWFFLPSVLQQRHKFALALVVRMFHLDIDR
jgi:hypothetical protein